MCECESRGKRELGDKAKYTFSTRKRVCLCVCVCVCTCACVSRNEMFDEIAIIHVCMYVSL